MSKRSILARLGKLAARGTGRDSRAATERSGESGYAFLVVMGMIIIMAILSQEVLQNYLTEGLRAREDEMIWRGNQYVRAIRLYYRKTGHYPQSIDDLKQGMPELHFLRYAAYKDPTNKDEDGAWRFIYVNASGQLLCSVRYANLQQMALMDLNGGKIPVGATLGSIGTPVANMASGAMGQGAGTSTNTDSLAPTQNGNSSTPSSSGSTTANAAQGGSQNSASSQGALSDQSSSSDQLVNPLSLLKPTGPCDGPVIGGFLTGVGGGTKSDAKSIKVVNSGKKYKDWEFIWNPLEDQARALQAGIGALGQPASNGLSQPPSVFGNPGAGGTNPGFGGAVMPPSTPPQPQN
jgi:hypothetical protein